MKYDFIGIEEAYVTGIKNSMFVIRGTINRKKYKFKILVDNTEIKDYEFFVDNDHFNIKVKLKSNDRVIKVFRL